MSKKAKILLIDDDIDFVDATRIILESKSYDVVTAYDGSDGLRLAKHENPNLIILDVIMPLKDGFSVAAQLKKDPLLSKLPIIMLTAFSTKGRETSIPLDRGLSLEAEDYIEKPISPEELLARVEKQLRIAGSR